MSVLALDLGGTNLRALHLEMAPKPGALPELLLSTKAPTSLAAFAPQVVQLIAQTKPSAIGIAIPGLVASTTCSWVPNLPWLDSVDLATTFDKQPVFVANDAQMALVAEASAGAAQNADTAILAAIGTGIGSALMVNRQVLRGGATSFGWACADVAAPGNDKLGWLESHAAGRALDRAARHIGLPDGPALIDAARSGDAKARGALAPATAALGTALSGAVALTGASHIIISGGVARAFDVLGPDIRARLVQHLPPHLRDITLAPAAFGAFASLAGAALEAQGKSVWEEDKK